MAKEGDTGQPENDNPDDDETEDDDASSASENDDADDDDDDSGEDDKGSDDLKKAISRRDRALRRARKAEAELAALKNKDSDKDKGPTAEEKANARTIRVAAHGILRGLGIEEKEDRAAVLDVLNLSDIDVDDDGADEEAIEERIEDLRRILAPKSGGAPGRTVPRTTRKNAGTKETQTDPDASRYKRILGRG